MVLPNFFCPGAQKAGTTTLHDILRQHPDIFLPISKEAWFFHRDEKFSKGLQWYASEYFSAYGHQKAIGEITPEYMYFETVAERIFRSLGGHIKFLFSFRNPVDRAFSQYQMSCRRGVEKLPFETAIEVEQRRIRESFTNRIHFSYLSRGWYSQQVERYLRYFPFENMHFLVFEEDIANGLEETIQRIQAFLEVEVRALNCRIVSNPASAPRVEYLRDMLYQPNPVRRILKRLIPSTRLRARVRRSIDRLNQVPLQRAGLEKGKKQRLMTEFFMADIKRLENMIQRDLSVWYADS